MPYSYSLFKDEVKTYLLNISTSDKILDVGPGCGTYGIMLNDTHIIDAIEIYEPYIERFNLSNKYNNVYIGDICKFDFREYDFVILGDVLEHIRLEDSIHLIDKINALGKKCLVAVPYLYEQGEWEGNIHETHHQPDLTPNKMKTRYPSLKLLIGDNNYGYYTN
jgi:hypothetical protein